MRTVHTQFLLHLGSSIYLPQKSMKSWVNSYRCTHKENLISPNYPINS